MVTRTPVDLYNIETTWPCQTCSNYLAGFRLLAARQVVLEVPMSSKALAGFVLSSLFLLTSLSAVAKSSVRIVRLSYVEGSVQIDRGTGKYEKAFVNFPITEGVKLRAQSESRAEIEFEDGTTLRLVPDTTVQFPQLSLEDSGTKVSTVEILRGTAYINYA